MSFEIIRRKEGEESQKKEIRHSYTQVSINDWGHLVIRSFDSPKYEDYCEYGTQRCLTENANDPEASVCDNTATGVRCSYYKKRRVDHEDLVVFDTDITDRIIRFIIKTNHTYEFKEFIKGLIAQRSKDIF